MNIKNETVTISAEDFRRMFRSYRMMSEMKEFFSWDFIIGEELNDLEYLASRVDNWSVTMHLNCAEGCTEDHSTGAYGRAFPRV